MAGVVIGDDEEEIGKVLLLTAGNCGAAYGAQGGSASDHASHDVTIQGPCIFKT
jgi:hypothetical protein